MPVVGFHQARRPRQTPMARLRRELSWPRPGGVILSLAGAALVFSGAMTLPVADVGARSPAPASLTGTTPDTSQEHAAPAPLASMPATAPATTGPSSSAPSSLSASGGTAAAIAPSPPPAPPVRGAAAESPLQKLFVSGAGTPTDTSLLDLANPASPLVLVNKRNPLLPLDYTPNDLVAPAVATGSGEAMLLRSEAAAAAERMFATAAAQGVSLTVKSSYRSYATQVGVYNGYVANKGVEAADSTSARPGFSEHQTGLALDIGDANAGTGCDFTSCFANTTAGAWVAAHAADYGFVVRYVPGQETTTGYLAEPWHLRYLGAAVAQSMRDSGIPSYEKFAGLPDAPDYG